MRFSKKTETLKYRTIAKTFGITQEPTVVTIFAP